MAPEGERNSAAHMDNTVQAGRIYRIRVRNLVLMASVGIYPHELHAPQRVRFNITLAVEEHAGPLDDNIGNVLSYADVVAGVRRIVSHGHVNLVETLAEEIAVMCLAYPRVIEAVIAVGKLDIEPDAESVGIEITRRRGEVVATNARRYMEEGTAPWVVKFGGGLAGSDRLKEWIDGLAAARRPLVIVPGIGPFGDRIGELRDRWRFSQHAALEMGLSAMEQFGRMLAGMDWRLRLCADLLEFGRAFDENRVAVWLPLAMSLGRTQAEEGEGLTADALAVWLAGRMRAQGVVLVKPVQPAQEQISVRELIRKGLAEPSFAQAFNDSGVDGWCVGMDEPVSFLRAITHGGPPGTRIVAEE